MHIKTVESSTVLLFFLKIIIKVSLINLYTGHHFSPNTAC